MNFQLKAALKASGCLAVSFILAFFAFAFPKAILVLIIAMLAYAAGVLFYNIFKE